MWNAEIREKQINRFVRQNAMSYSTAHMFAKERVRNAFRYIAKSIWLPSFFLNSISTGKTSYTLSISKS